MRRYGKPLQGAIVATILGLVPVCLLPHPVLAAEDSISRTFCVLVPHFKDEYWLSVGYGLEQQAKKQDVKLLFFEAGGYRSRERQITQLYECRDRQVDAILIGAVTSEHPELLSAVSEVNQDMPVFGLVNELHAPELRASIGVDWEDMGLVIGQYLAARHPAGTEVRTAVLISGPPESGWIGPLETGLRNGLKGSSLQLVEVFGADTGLRQQLKVVEQAFERYPDTDYLVGSAPAVEAAIGVLTQGDQSARPTLVSTYISHTIKRSLSNGQVLAVPFDDPMAQGDMAIRAAVGEIPLEKDLGFIGPEVVLLTRDQDLPDKIRLSPSDYFPTIE